MPTKDVKEILRKYGRKIEGQINTSKIGSDRYSREYTQFKSEMSPEFTRYEKWCNVLGNVIKLKVGKKERAKTESFLQIAHLDVTPEQALTLAFMSFVVAFLVGLSVSAGIFLIRGVGDIGNFPFLFFFLVVVFSAFLFYFVHGYPSRLANKWRLKASSQMVPAILYIVVYMRHTANLEKAIAFAAENLGVPLSLDFRKVFYDVQIGRFSTIKESLDFYLESWKDYGLGFVESFHLIESSLFEPDNARRIQVLEKALQVILDGVYDGMLKFTHSVRSPLTNVYMLGVVLPTLGLALLPLASAMIGEYFRWYHVFILFNLIVPFFVFYLTDQIMMKRPGGYGETQLLKRNPLYPKYVSKRPYLIAGLICFPLLILGLLPLIFQYTPVSGWVGIRQDFALADVGLGFLGKGNLFEFKEVGGQIVGPYGFGALLLSLFVPLSLALFFSISFKMRSKELIVDRNNTKELENEFTSSLFQIGNRLGNGVPPELVFGKIAEVSRGQKTADFFNRVNYNIQKSGMSVEKAIFDSRRGAIIYYPSEFISTSMRILVESSKKGLKIAAVSLMSISEYLKNIKKINMRLKDMLAAVISDMRSNMTFLAPLLSGIVVSLAAMITEILDNLEFMNILDGQEVSLSMVGGLGGIIDIFSVTKMIPPYFLQIAVGIYIIEIIFILSGTLVVVDSGEDKLEKTNKTGKNLMRGVLLYFIVAFVGIFLLYFLATMVLSGL